MKKEQLEIARHSTAHLMAAAVLELFPQAKFGVGPVVENGFYYDFELPRSLTPLDLAKIEKKMKELKQKNLPFEKQEMGLAEAIKLFESLGQKYKVELLEDIKKFGTTKLKDIEDFKDIKDIKKYRVSIYKTGKFVDLCRGPHVENTKELGKIAFKLNKIAGAYWRGDEKREQLQRIYGLSFENQAELDAHLKMLEEAEKRDHRVLGRELEIFTFSDEIGPGLPLWLPKGTILREELEKLAKEKEQEMGYERVSTPVITKEALFFKSGHLPHYRESMYSPMNIDDEKYYLKPMNCPFHHAIYASSPRSYRDLPLRLAEYGLCHRYEKSGELQGLMRVRSLMMNDAHIYVRPDQVKEEIKQVIKLHEYYYRLFQVKEVSYRLSLHDPADLGGKYVDMPRAWKENEQILREVLKELKVKFYEAENEAAFYGPKIDINIKSVIGKEYTLGTVQLDFSQPQKFNLVYTDKDGKEKMPYCIHRAPLSVHERMIGFLIEHFAGAFPVWLSPVQVALIPVGAAHVKPAQKLAKEMKEAEIRVEVYNQNETVGYKIRRAEKQKVPYMIVLGDKEAKNKKLPVRLRGQQKTREMSAKKFIDKVREEIEKRK